MAETKKAAAKKAAPKKESAPAPKKEATPVEAKTLGNTTVNKAHDNVDDLVVYGNGDAWQLICKVSSEKEGWMKSTKAMPVGSAGVLVQVTTQQRNKDGSYAVAEAVTYVPGAVVKNINNNKENGRIITTSN